MSQLRDLAKPFPQRFVHDNPSGYGSYVAHSVYVQRLLMHLGGYDFETVEIIRGQVNGKPDLGTVVVGVVMRLTVKIDGRRVVIEEIGDCEMPGNWDTDGKRLKDAYSDALKRCCARIGLGLSLYAKNADEYVLSAVLREREEIEAGPSGGGEPSGQTLVAGNPAGESKDLTVPANPSPAPSEFCEACVAGDCQHCTWREDGELGALCLCEHDEGRPM